MEHLSGNYVPDITQYENQLEHLFVALNLGSSQV